MIKIHIPRNPKRLLVLSGAAVLVAAFVFQIVFDTYVYRSLIRPGDVTPITNLIISSVEGLYRVAPTDPLTGKVYLTDAKLVLPAPADHFTQLKYTSSWDNNTTLTELNVTSTGILNAAESKMWALQPASSGWRRDSKTVFDQVPNLQACARGVQVFYQPVTDRGPHFQVKGSKTLANGKTLYFYIEDTCKADLTPLVTYLKQAQSY